MDLTYLDLCFQGLGFAYNLDLHKYFLHLFTSCFMKISPQSSELIQLLILNHQHSLHSGNFGGVWVGGVGGGLLG